MRWRTATFPAVSMTLPPDPFEQIKLVVSGCTWQTALPQSCAPPPGHNVSPLGPAASPRLRPAFLINADYGAPARRRERSTSTTFQQHGSIPLPCRDQTHTHALIHAHAHTYTHPRDAPVNNIRGPFLYRSGTLRAQGPGKNPNRF